MYRVCIVEDEEIIRKGLIRSIDWENFNSKVVGDAANGLEGYKLIEREKPDIIILDINMPIMDGIQLLEKLPRHTYAVIIISGHSEFSYAKKAIEYGVSEYLLKPLDHDELVQSLHRAIQDIEMRRSYEVKSDEAEIVYQALKPHNDIESTTLQMALKYIQDNYNEKITLDDLRQHTGRSVTLINNRFQKFLGMTFNDYLTRFRIQKAIELMQEGNLHLYEIAEDIGFNDYKYFNQVFQKIIGTSPKIVLTYFARVNAESE
ncbi:response regulator [Erysipelothrix sp. HDW6A]|uniref:response regulator transcription factor n=1 Tax=Erysipelothrix sp. HDW6A TaxID=2714928 RepID=UPI00196AB6C9|nr:response regulator [Erysipelothrix sp. HDW6A]